MLGQDVAPTLVIKLSLPPTRDSAAGQLVRLIEELDGLVVLAFVILDNKVELSVISINRKDPSTISYKKRESVAPTRRTTENLVA
jgi:hypothetical protein